jgi:hypothetical protein
MKLFKLLFVSLFFSIATYGQTLGENEYAKIEYKSFSRGFFRKVKLENHMIYTVNTRKDKYQKLAKKTSFGDWKEVYDAFRSIDLSQIQNLKSPTEKRFYGGAPEASVTITFNGKEYVSSDFDEGFPPQEIKKLVEKIIYLGKEEK